MVRPGPAQGPIPPGGAPCGHPHCVNGRINGGQCPWCQGRGWYMPKVSAVSCMLLSLDIVRRTCCNCMQLFCVPRGLILVVFRTNPLCLNSRQSKPLYCHKETFARHAPPTASDHVSVIAEIAACCSGGHRMSLGGVSHDAWHGIVLASYSSLMFQLTQSKYGVILVV